MPPKPPLLSTLLRCFTPSAAPHSHAAVSAPATASQPLAGWLLSYKANLAALGQPLDASSRALAGYSSPYTSTVLQRCQAAGGVLCAQPSNMDEFGMGSGTAFSAHGASYNPYSANAYLSATLPPSALPPSGWLSPGGSSGGGAAAVACGAAHGALGSDTGGSVRQPAALCGIVGLKPTRGGLSRWGLVAYASSLDTVGLLAPSVAAARALFAVAAGRDERDETSLFQPPQQQQQQQQPPSSTPLAGLRIGIPREYHTHGACAHTVQAWEQAAQACVSLGAECVQVSLPHTPLALPTYYALAAGQAASNLARYDSLRYGPSAPAAAAAAAAATTASSGATQASALHAMYTASRSAHLGVEVARRVLVGNAVLSAASRGAYYAAAEAVCQAIAGDFGAVFRRSASSASSSSVPPTPTLLTTLGNPAFWPAAQAHTGCDLLLTPCSPSPPWVSLDTPALPVMQVYAGDVCTLPASLAGLPAVSLPWGHAPYPQDALARAVEEVVLAGGAGSGSGSGSRGGGGGGEALEQQLRAALRVPVGLQLVGRHGEEGLLLQVAEALERVACFQRPAYTQQQQQQLPAAAGK